MVLLVSDPAVDVLSSLGNRISIPPFYVAFLLAPLASNASELIAAYNYAAKRTPSSIGASLNLTPICSLKGFWCRSRRGVVVIPVLWRCLSCYVVVLVVQSCCGGVCVVVLISANEFSVLLLGVSLSQLEGAGIMNNTFVLGIFFLVMFMNGTIAWTFTAETLGIVFAEVIVAFIAQKKVCYGLRAPPIGNAPLTRSL